MKEKVLRNLALPEGLGIVETTDASNGYPSHLQDAVIGFENFEQAKAFADEYNLTLCWLEKKDGWNLYHRREIDVREPMTLTAMDFGGNANFETDADECLKAMKEQISCCETFEDVKRTVEHWEEIIEALEEKDDDEVVVTIDGDYHETINPTCIEFSYDTWTTILGAVE